MVHKSLSLSKRRFHGLMRPMKLKSGVKTSRKEPGHTPCLQEMTAVMSCWKANTYDDLPCRKEIQQFVLCAERVRQESGEKKQVKDRSGSIRYDTEELNKRMRSFVWPQ